MSSLLYNVLGHLGIKTVTNVHCISGGGEGMGANEDVHLVPSIDHSVIMVALVLVNKRNEWKLYFGNPTLRTERGAALERCVFQSLK